MAKSKAKRVQAAYAQENRALKNKVRKLERHIKKFPNDKQSAGELSRIKSSGYTGRTKPNRTGGRLGSGTILFQQLQKQAKVAMNLLAHSPKAQREAAAKVKAEKSSAKAKGKKRTQKRK